MHHFFCESMKKILLIDNSNKRTKFFTHSKGGKHLNSSVISTQEISEKKITNSFDFDQFEQVFCASVVPDVDQIFARVFGNKYHSLTYQNCGDIQIDITQPETLGADRIANVLGALKMGQNEFTIVIDFGTAVTFDIIASNQRYLGGVIAPGLGAMNDYLTKKTALLPYIQFTEPERSIGKNTTEAMNIGGVFGYRGMIRGILSKIIDELTQENSVPKTTIIATGGDAKLISENMPEIDAFDPEITMRGLWQFALLHLN